MNRKMYINNNPIVEVDESLENKDNQVTASKKLAKANAILATSELPKKHKTSISVKLMEGNLTPLQVELLRFYAINPSEYQMKLLKDFLRKLFTDTSDSVATNI
jgi:hypothetical protein